MKKEIVAAGFVLFSFMLPLKATAAQFSQLYVFGDSLVDTGNLFDAVGIPPSPPYFQGRFSNGPIWVEYLASELGLTYNPATNFAFGGATTGTDNTIISGNPFNLPGLQQQINSFTTANPSVDQNALYIVWAGGNDYLGGGVTNPSVPVTNLANAVTSLSGVGAKNIMVVNLPNLGDTPATSDDPNPGLLNTLTAFHNSALRSTVNVLRQQTDTNIILLDANSVFSQIFTTPEEFNFTNVTEACLNFSASTICNNPNEYFFWDGLHPTTRGHSFIAKSALVAVPEPSPALGILGLAALGAGSSLLKRKHTKASLHSSNSGS